MTTSSEPSSTGRLERLGTTSWRLLGVVAIALVAASATAALAGIVIPVIVAVYVAILAVSVVDTLEARRVPRPVGSLLVVTVVVGIFVGVVVLAGVGVAGQASEIRAQVASGLDDIGNWFEQLDFGSGDGQAGWDDVVNAGKQLLPGAAAYVSTVFNSALSLVFGLFVSLFVLYYLLADWSAVTRWVEAHLGVSRAVGRGIVDETAAVMRQNFKALTATSLIVTGIIAVTMLILGLPLVFTVALVTFITSYIPYLGAFFSGAFGFLVALGAGGTSDALILLVVILVAQNAVQTVVGNKVASAVLSVHPLAAFLVTILGFAVAGLVGGILAPPLLALGLALHGELGSAPSAAD